MGPPQAGCRENFDGHKGQEHRRNHAQNESAEVKKSKPDKRNAKLCQYVPVYASTLHRGRSRTQRKHKERCDTRCGAHHLAWTCQALSLRSTRSFRSFRSASLVLAKSWISKVNEKRNKCQCQVSFATVSNTGRRGNTHQDSKHVRRQLLSTALLSLRIGDTQCSCMRCYTILMVRHGCACDIRGTVCTTYLFIRLIIT